MGFFGIEFGKPKALTSTLPVLWDVQLRASLYTEIQLRSIYARILSEVFARSYKIPDAFRSLLRDSMEGGGQRGLIEHIVCAMANQSELILKYEAGILHVPEYNERRKIIDEWKRVNKPQQTLYLSFQNYHKTTMLRQYLLHKYLLLCTQHKALNLSASLLIKIADLRKSVALNDSTPAKDQAREIAQALLDGAPALLDVEDMIELPKPDMSVLKEVAEDVHSEISLILGLPISWVAGIQKTGLGDSGDADARAIERGLEPYFWESAYPSFRLLFDNTLRFKTEDYRNVSQALEAMRTFQLDDGQLLPKELQQRILYQLLDIQEEPPGVKEPKVIEAPAAEDEGEDEGEGDAA